MYEEDFGLSGSPTNTIQFVTGDVVAFINNRKVCDLASNELTNSDGLSSYRNCVTELLSSASLNGSLRCVPRPILSKLACSNGAHSRLLASQIAAPIRDHFAKPLNTTRNMSVLAENTADFIGDFSQRAVL